MLRSILGTLLCTLVGAQNKDPELLATHGGYSFYKVFINPALYAANTPMLDNVVSSTCLGATRGVPPQAPCPSSSPACKFYSSIHCKGTSEEGCDQPMLTTSLAMQCSSAIDPGCRLRSKGSLIGTNGGCLWAHMGQAWDSNGACGNCYCAAVAGTDCNQLSTFCQKGKDYTVDGSIWPGCTTRVVATVTTCTAGGATAAFPDTNMEHWAFCVGRAVCKCVHGDCDPASEQGNCQLGTCAPGWHGQLCNLRCDPSYCLNRNNPAVVPPTNVISSGYNGVWTTVDNQCHCECLPQYGPSGTGGPQGTQCADCIQPGQLQCTPYVGKYLASTTPTGSVQRGIQFAVEVEARFVQNDQVDSSLTEVITVEKAPGGGNGDGGTLLVQTQNSQLNQGRVTMIMQFSDACDACYLTFKDTRGILQPLSYGPIRVTTSGTHLVATTAHTSIGIDDTITIRLQAVDGVVGSAGSIDVTSPGVVTARLQTNPNGGNGGGCSISPDVTSALTQSLTAGQGEWRLKFGCACDACYIVFEDQSQTRTLPTFSYGPISVASQARTLGCRTPTGAACLTSTLQQGNSVYSVFVRSLDPQGNLDQSAAGTVTVAITGGNVNGATLQNAGGTTSLTQPLLNGESPFDLSFTRACESCVVTATSSDPNILPYTFPTLRVVSNAIGLAISSVVPASVNVGQSFIIVVEARDASGNVDTTWNGNVGASLVLNGGNGNGGDLQLADGTANLVRTLTNGVGSWSLKFTASCTSCIIQFSDTAASSQRINPVQTPGILVGTSSVRMSLRTGSPSSIPAGNAFTLMIQTTDSQGNVDTSNSGRVNIALRPNGGNGNGGDLTDPLTLSRDMQGGETQFSLTFSQSCTQCLLDVTHSSLTIPPLVVGPILVTTSATKLLIVTPVPSVVETNQPFPLTVRAVDASNNIDVSNSGSFVISTDVQGNNGNGGTLGNAGGGLLQQSMVNGEVSWQPQFSSACQACGIVVRDLQGQLSQVKTDNIQVGTRATSLILSPFTTLRRQVNVNDEIEIIIFAVDSDGNKATLVPVTITGVLAPNGGNGDGQAFAFNSPTVQTTAGEARFTARFGGACTACSLSFTHNSSQISLTLPSINVLTRGTRMIVGTLVQTVAKGSTVQIPLRVVDAKGNTDTAWVGRVTASVSSSGVGTGTPLTASNGLTAVYNEGLATFSLTFGSACESCELQFTDTSGTLPQEVISNIRVTTSTERLEIRQTSTASTSAGEPFVVTVRALDSDGNVNVNDRSEVSLRLPSGVSPPGGEAVRLASGVASFTVSMTEDCPAPCTLTPSYSQGTGGASSVSSELLTLNHLNATPTPDSGGDDDGVNPLIWVLVVILILLLLAALAFCAYKYWKSRQNSREVQYPDKEISDISMDPGSETGAENPIEQVFPDAGPARGGDRPWMVDVDASSPQPLVQAPPQPLEPYPPQPIPLEY